MKIKFNKEALRQLRESPAVRADLEERAKRIADACSQGGRVTGYKVTDVGAGKTARRVLCYGDRARGP